VILNLEAFVHNGRELLSSQPVFYLGQNLAQARLVGWSQPILWPDVFVMGMGDDLGVMRGVVIAK
jgi:hypothetical protein